MDIFKSHLNIFEEPPSVFFSLADPFVQKYYKYNKGTLEYYLKLALILGKSVDITAANIWQSNLTMQLFQSTIRLNKCGLINLAIRKSNQNGGDFIFYFKQRLDEGSHFIPLPGILSFLDYQLPETASIAKELDFIARANERKAGNVTEIYSQKITTQFGAEDKWLLENLLDYKEKGLISRATVADAILKRPYNDVLKQSLIINSNNLLLLANAEVNQSQLMYPINKHEVSFSRPFSTQIEIIALLKSVGLSSQLIASIPFESFYEAFNKNILQNIQRFLWFLRKKGSNNQLAYKFVLLLAQYEVYKLKNIAKYSIKDEVNIIDSKDVFLNIDANKLFYSNLNQSIIFMTNKEVKENNEIQLSILMQELMQKLDFEELKNLAVDMFGDYQMIPFDNKLVFVREFCLKCKRQDRLVEILQKAMKINPAISILKQDDLNLLDLDWKGADKGEYGNTIPSNQLEQMIYNYSRFQTIGFLEQGFRISKRICMIKAPSFSASAFWINRSYILTNKHVLENPERVEGAEVWLNYETSSRNKYDFIEKYPLDKRSLIVSKEFDLAICKVVYENTEYLLDFPKIDCGKLELNDIIPIIQHPNGLEKQICIGHNSLKFFDDNCLQYITDTLPGSSGSPVFNSKWQLIGLHRAGSNIASPRSGGYYLRNEGVPINRILEFLKENSIELS